MGCRHQNKKNAVYLSTQLVYIFNLQLTQGIFLNLLKHAIMVSVYESGSSKDPGNCKPIPLLSTFSKVLEELYYTHLLVFINRNNVLHNNQFGFRPGKSTSLASTLLLSSLLAKYNANKKTVLLYWI